MSYHVLYKKLFIQSYTVYIYIYYIYTIPLGKQKKKHSVFDLVFQDFHLTIPYMSSRLLTVIPAPKSSGHRTTKPLARRMVVTSCFKSDKFTIGKGWSIYLYILCNYLFIIYIYISIYTYTYHYILKKNKNKKHCWVSWFEHNLVNSAWFIYGVYITNHRFHGVKTKL